jgi:glutamate-1-semialdehyde 2,1-aminomutase
MPRNERLFERARKLLPGGVNSPVRAFGAVGGTPPTFVRGEGVKVWDADDKSYVDFVGSWGPLIVGHAHPAVVAAVAEAAKRGLSFGAPTEIELEMAELLCRLVPAMQKVRLVSSGTEATMSAIRLARGFTGRNRIVKFEGCYHGHADSLLVKGGSGLLTFNQPSSAGVPAEVAAATLVLEYNNVGELERAFAGLGSEIAAVIVEPVAGNMNLVLPEPDFLPALRHHCTRAGTVLIFDEVMTGFRVGPKSAQGLYAIEPDLSTFGKVIGGGLPVAAFGGRAEIMDKLAPEGPVYQAGTLSGNPVALAAGLATLKLTLAPGFYEALAATTKRLGEGLERAAHEAGVRFSARTLGGMFGLYFRETSPRCFAEVMQCDLALFRRFFHAMLERGYYFAPSAFEAGFVSSVHSAAEIESAICAAREVFSEIGVS